MSSSKIGLDDLLVGGEFAHVALGEDAALVEHGDFAVKLILLSDIGRNVLLRNTHEFRF